MGVARNINDRVKAQYEAFPYPHYNLLLPLRSQEAYASNSLFAARVLEQQGMEPALRTRPGPAVLLAGCGDTLPYMATFWEPRGHRITALDLSTASLRRARFRSFPRFRPIYWRQGNLEDPSLDLPPMMSHIDCYGVLHHLADPAAVLKRFERGLLPGGTLRVMVYNSGARTWLRHLQRALDLLGLSAFESGDLDRGRRLLENAAAVSPALKQRFAPMQGAFANPARFVDTFLHAREARLGLDYWLRAIEEAGLRLAGLFDRYGELDDLPNPLLQVPGREAWMERIADRRFENNLELFLAKPGAARKAAPGAPAAKLPSLHSFMAPPMAWFEYEETRNLPWMARRTLWTHFLDVLGGPGGRGQTDSLDALGGRLDPRSLQRLARIGAIFPDDFESKELRDLLSLPIHASMEPPDFGAPGPVIHDPILRAQVQIILQEKGRPSKYLERVMARLEAAQNP